MYYEEIKAIMAATGLNFEAAFGYWQDQQAFSQIGAEIAYQQKMAYESLSSQGQSFADNLSRQCQAAQANAWR